MIIAMRWEHPLKMTNIMQLSMLILLLRVSSVKHFTTGEGGALLTNNAHLDEIVRRLRTHGMTKDPSKLSQNDGPWYYEMHELGYNYRITDFQCP